MTNWTPNSAMVHKYAVGAALFLGLILGAGGASHAVDIKVAASGNIQDAINQCPDNDATGCRILLQGRTYNLPNALFIRGKNNLTLMAATSTIRPTLVFQDDGSKTGPFDLKDDADSIANRPAGWKHWPIDDEETKVGGSKNLSNPYSTSGIQHNGVILIKNSHDIVIDGIAIDGKKPLGFGSLGIWPDQGYPTFYGNFGINLFLSGRVTVRNTEIKNCFAAFFIFNRNKGGALAHNNQADLDKGDLAPGSRYGEMGGHIVEYSNIHHNVWAAFEESGWDLGTTWRFNKLWQLHNDSKTFAKWMQGASPCFDRSNWEAGTFADAKSCANDEAKIHAGGFIFLKDNLSVPDRVYNNTFWKVSAIFSGPWRAGLGHAFYNNVVAQPWLDYNKDTSAFMSENFTSAMSPEKNLLGKMSEFVRGNTFAYFPVIDARGQLSPSETGCTGDSCKAKVAALKAKVWPPTRLSFQSQQVQGTQYNGKYVQPISKYYYIDGVQYQGQERKFLFQPWTLEEPNKVIDTVRYKTMLAASDNGTAVGLVEFSYAGRDSSQIAPRFGGIRGLPLADTVGRILKLGTQNTKDMTSYNNHYIKSLPFNTDTAAANFLAMDWTDKGVDSVVLGDVWAPQGYTFTNMTGAAAARGAVQPDGGTGIQKLTVTDDQPALIVGDVASLSFSVISSVQGLSNLQWVHGQFTPNVPVADGVQEYTGDYAPITIPAGSISGAPVIGSNVITIKLPVKPGPYSRIDLVVAGTTPTGEKVMSNLAIWVIRKSDYSFDVRFFAKKGDTTAANKVDTIKAGYPVWMRVQPMINTAGVDYIPTDSCIARRKTNPTASCEIAVVKESPYTGGLGAYSIKAGSMWDVDPAAPGATPVPNDALYKGGTYVPVGTADANINNVAWIQVWFTKAGMVAPMNTALGMTNGKTDTGKVFQGVGLIYVRPGDPYIAELRDPASYRLTGDNDSLPMISSNSKAKAFIDVKDKYGNIVDVPTKITLSALVAAGTGALEPNVKVGDLTNSAGVVDVPATGSVQTFIQASTSSFTPPIPPVDWFWLKSWIGTGTTPDVGTVPDSSRVHVAKAERILQWSQDDSIYREIRDTAHVHLVLLDGKNDVVVDKNFYAKLGSGSGQVKFYLPSDVARANPLDSIGMDGMVELVVSSNVPVSLDSIFAFNDQVNSGEPVVQDSVTFYYSPPPFPVVDTAAFVDTDCDGAADQLRVWLKAGGFGGIDTLDTTKVKFKGMALQVGASTISYDSSEMSYLGARKNAFAFPLKGITSSLASVSGKVSVVFALKRKNAEDSLVLANDSAGVFAMDRVSPRVDSAVVMENYSSAQDEFYVRFTEPVTFTGAVWPLVTKTGNAVNNTASVSIVSFTPDADALLGPNTYKVVVTGNRNAAFDPLYVHYTDSVQLSLLSQVVDAANNGGDGCAAAVLLSVRSVLPSFSGAIWSDDSLGQANRLTVTFSRALKAEEQIDSLAIAFGGVVRTVYTGSNWVSSNRATWTLSMPYPFPYGLTRGAADAAYGASVVVFGTNTGSGTTTYLPRAGLVRDSVPVVFVNKSGVGTPMIAINYGKGVDTLLFELSEPVADIPTGKTGLRVAASGADVAMVGQSLLGSTSVMMIQSTLAPSNRLQPGDWALLGDKLIGADGLMPAVIKPSKALVVGGDRGPQDAVYLDTDADGVADAVSMVFASPLKTSPSFVFRIGGQSRTVDSTNGLVIAADRLSAMVDFRIATPFTAVQTYVTAMDYGTMTSSMVGVAAVTDFSVRDGIAPVILRADLTYASYSDAAHMDDTLHLKLSEPVALASTQSNIAWFISEGTSRSSQAPVVQKGVGLQIGTDEVLLFLDTNKVYTYLGTGDSVRIAPIDAAGEMTDLYGNAPTLALAKWTKVTAGLRPPRFAVDIFPSPLMVIDPVNRPDLNGMGSGPQMSVYVTSTKTPGVLHPLAGSVSGPAPINEALILGNAIGPRFTVNGPFEATAIVYDNIGVFVGQIAVQVTQQMIDAGGFAAKDGSFEVVILWNGHNIKNLPVGTGVYMFRVVVYRDQKDALGNKERAMVMNEVTKVGVKSATK